MPAWNAEATLSETLHSVADQTYQDIEIVIVDDGSSDRTAAVARAFSDVEPRARLLRQENGGPAAARNRGIAHSKAPWVALIDADDLWHPTKLEKQVAAALAAPRKPGFVYCWYRTIDAEGFVTGSGPDWAIDGFAFDQLAYNHFIRGGSGLLLSREAIAQVGGFDESFRDGCEDVLLELQIARRFPILAVGEYLFGYRTGRDSFTRDFHRLLGGWQRAFAAAQERSGGFPARVNRWVEAHCSFDVAEQRAREGKLLEATVAFAKGIALDPIHCGIRLIGRGADLATRGRPTRHSTAPRRHFFDVGTTERIDAANASLAQPLLRRIDAARMRSLAAEKRPA